MVSAILEDLISQAINAEDPPAFTDGAVFHLVTAHL